MGRQPRQSCLHDREVAMSTEPLTSKRNKGLAVCSAVITPLLMYCPPAGSADRDIRQVQPTTPPAINSLKPTVHYLQAVSEALQSRFLPPATISFGLTRLSSREDTT